MRIWDITAQNELGETKRILGSGLTTTLNVLDPQFSDFVRIIARSYTITTKRWVYLKTYGISGVEVIG